MNLKNVIENLVICIICILVGVGIGHVITKKTSESLVEIIKPTINKAIDKETLQNTITNSINNSFRKIKNSDTLQVNINQEPFNDLKPTSTINKTTDCAISTADFNTLSESRQKRIERWLKD